MPVIEAQRASILEPHDHRHINQKSETVWTRHVGNPRARSGSDLNLVASSVGARLSPQAKEDELVHENKL